MKLLEIQISLWGLMCYTVNAHAMNLQPDAGWPEMITSKNYSNTKLVLESASPFKWQYISKGASGIICGQVPIFVDSMEAATEGKPIQIVVAKDDHTFELDEKALKSIVDRNGIRDKPIAVISVAGAFRKGKSFLLDFFIRYLQSKSSPDWLGPEDRPLGGFSWRGGSARVTTGIQAWSQVFPVSTPRGKVNVLLLDTQGMFDTGSTEKECTTIFALGSMISSVQIYNLSGNIQKDDLQHLQFFTGYGRLALEETDDKPFQKLMFLIRDWSNSYECAYGLAGGEKKLDDILTVTEKQPEEMRTLRKHIRSCFSDISCFLMPHPGLKVANEEHFDGRLSDMEAVFKTKLKELVDCVFSADNLAVKQIGGNVIRAQDLVKYFKTYTELFKGDKLPVPKSIFEATAETSNLSTVASAQEVYINKMEAVCGGNQPYVDTQHLEKKHMRIFQEAMQHFSSQKKMGGEDFSAQFKERLKHDIQKQFTQYKKQNGDKYAAAAKVAAAEAAAKAAVAEAAAKVAAAEAAAKAAVAEAAAKVAAAEATAKAAVAEADARVAAAEAARVATAEAPAKGAAEEADAEVRLLLKYAAEAKAGAESISENLQSAVLLSAAAFAAAVVITAAAAPLSAAAAAAIVGAAPTAGMVAVGQAVAAVGTFIAELDGVIAAAAGATAFYNRLFR